MACMFGDTGAFTGRWLTLLFSFEPLSHNIPNRVLKFFVLFAL
jgi:hypothetical protein